MKDESNRLKRLSVLEYSMELELALSKVLSDLLRIENRTTSISFGQTSQSLSFYQKVNLLLDTNGLNKQDRKNLICFMEIRNKFMHNREIETYLSVCTATKNYSYLKNQFPECFSNQNEEEELEKAINQLFRSCAMSIIQIKGLRKELHNIEKHYDREKLLHNKFVESSQKALKTSEESIKPERKYSGKEVKHILNNVGQIINALYIPFAIDEIMGRNKAEAKSDK